jgi:hypothetical protein
VQFELRVLPDQRSDPLNFAQTQLELRLAHGVDGAVIEETIAVPQHGIAIRRHASQVVASIRVERVSNAGDVMGVAATLIRSDGAPQASFEGSRALSIAPGATESLSVPEFATLLTVTAGDAITLRSRDVSGAILADIPMSNRRYEAPIGRDVWDFGVRNPGGAARDVLVGFRVA